MAEKYVDIAKQLTSDEINSKLGSTADTGGSSTEGTMQAKMNESLTLLDGIGTNISNLSVVKSVQFGTFSVPSTSNSSVLSISIAIATVNPSKSMLIVHDVYKHSDTYGIIQAALEAESLTLTFSSGSYDYKGSFQIVEFI